MVSSFNPFEKIWTKMGSSSLNFGVKLPKIFELPPPRWMLWSWILDLVPISIMVYLNLLIHYYTHTSWYQSPTTFSTSISLITLLPLGMRGNWSSQQLICSWQLAVSPWYRCASTASRRKYGCDCYFVDIPSLLVVSTHLKNISQIGSSP